MRWVSGKVFKKVEYKSTQEDWRELGEHLEESVEMIDGLENGTMDER